MSVKERASLRGKLLVLRLFRLKHLPPAWNATHLLHESGLPVLVMEFGNTAEKTRFIDSPLPTWRMATRWSRHFRKFQPVAAFLDTAVRLSFRILKEGRPRLLIAHGMQEQCIAWILSVLFRIPVVVQVHEIYALNELDRFNRLFFSWGLSTLRRAALLLYPERTRAKLYEDWYQVKTPYEIVYNAPRRHTREHPSTLRERLGLPAQALLMGYMGGIGRMHGFEETFLAMVEVPEVHFLIWGWGDEAYLRELQSKAKSYRVSARVHFLGKTDEQKWNDLEGCDFAYCVYKPEVLRLQHAATASNKLMEAMAAGLPVLTSDSPDFKEMVLRLDIGVCADPHSSSSIALALKELAYNEAGRFRRAHRALAAHENEYHFELQFQRSLEKIGKFFPATPTPPPTAPFGQAISDPRG